jgi:hypothetical protein
LARLPESHRNRLHERQMTSDVRKGMPDPQIDQETFKKRYLDAFYDPAFAGLEHELDHAAAVAWDAYTHGRKAPRTRPAGPEFADPGYDLSVEWLAAREAIKAAERAHHDPSGPGRILIVNGSPRSEHTCPGEMSKTHRLVAAARQALSDLGGTECEVLDLSRLTSEYGRQIHPCKACFSTAPPLCHWPCSCYPNHALGASARLDERHLSQMGRRARHPDRHAGALVSGAHHPQADDGPPGLRRRRQS